MAVFINSYKQMAILSINCLDVNDSCLTTLTFKNLSLTSMKATLEQNLINIL